MGITDPTTTQRQPPAEVVGLDTTRMAGLGDYLRDLKRKERSDVLVAVTHTGITVSGQIAREHPELDVVMSGHTHERTEHPILEGHVIVVEPGSMGSFLGRLDLAIENGNVTVDAFELIPIRASEVPEDPAVKRLVEKAIQPFRAHERGHLEIGGTSASL